MNSKNLKSDIIPLILISLMVLFNLTCLNKYQSGVASPVVAGTSSSQSVPSSHESRNISDDFPISLAKDSDIPVSVIGLQFLKDGARKGDLQIQIKNISEKPIKTVQYWLAPMPCRQYNVPSLMIDYKGSAISPNQIANIFVERKRLEAYLNPKGPSSIKCSSKPEDEEKPRLFLAKVFFDGGAVWEIGKQNSSSNSRYPY